ncbi:pentapeptide repeat-containing protein [Lentzea sp. NBRC 102530]|uniref:pentapeptide repeat-containing protein n=1 Tax=Lentzea sp. NBRC 102530 TaxID=3032201 RepID=UPI0024A09E15|nr:pentapeptide repeat-containing protein [Lentzea sp. NBRC 102530]GLY48097.1 hypothetical protein Lesp01_17530 [Lentzea sp. NBRC 102530]
MPTNRRLGLRAPVRRRKAPNWQTVTSVVTAVTAAGALVFTGLSLQATRDQVTVALKQHELTEQGQVTDRYTKAVEQLGKAGPENLHSRLGAVYALERLGRDSPRDQTTVLEVLLAFVRTTAQGVPDDSPARREKCGATTVDVQAALTVLGRRDPQQDRGFKFDLRRLCLAGVNLTEASLEGADLRGSVLSEALLLRTNLSRAQLDHTDLFRVQADDARFVSASLSSAVFSSALLERTDFTGATLSYAKMTETYLKNAILDRASLNSTDLSGARLHDAKHHRTRVEGVVVNDQTEGEWW